MSKIKQSDITNFSNDSFERLILLFYDWTRLEAVTSGSMNRYYSSLRGMVQIEIINRYNKLK